jgi:hypothetical protein
MVIIETENWGNFEGSDLKEAKEKFVEKVAPTNSNNFIITDVLYDGDYLSDYLVREIERDLESEIKEWRRVAEIESEGLRRAQQESIEG